MYIVNEKVDIINLNLYIFAANIIFTLINYFVEIKLVVCLMNIIQYTLLVSSVLLVISYIVKNNYSFVFKEISEKNKKLEKINYKIIKNNIKLEEKYENLNEKYNFLKIYSKIIKSIVVINKNFRIFYCNESF